MTPTTRQLIEWDKTFLWHPFTPMKPWVERDDTVVIERAEGDWLIDTEGRRYLDGVSSLWCNVHGHRVPELDAAVIDQLQNVAHTSLLGLANVPSVLLGKRLVELVRGVGLGLEKVFYSDDGSTAVEVACKMAFQYWRNVGERGKVRFLALRDAYHGDTVGAVSVGGISFFHDTYRPLCFPAEFVSVREGVGEMERALAAHPGEYAAVVMEPVVQGAGGMIVHPRGTLRAVRALCDRHQVLLIADEVMTGFGRTGKMFACEHDGGGEEGAEEGGGVTPDFLCLSKGLTAGYMPLGATLTTQKVFDAFYADPREMKTFFHGHTFTGHALACAVALASLDLFEKNQTLVHANRLADRMRERLAPCERHPHVKAYRQVGLIAAIDLVYQKENGARPERPFPYHWRVGGALCQKMRALGVMLRPLGDTLVLMPPLALRPEHLEQICDAVLTSLEWIPGVIQDKQREFPAG